ncbi:hypothetical protein TCAL_13250 [Tigriopus californicus]|uniref:DUF5641 domain-containing protein n=1 Tax=Tigriopus californicus TaxID=6832 RepID=A0A553P8F5_TIGCA|nr:hypothetical protein TCAL_13250 [Tigriopus californicus]|eukprot:TCALIF_13250-PA protein Name:"Protein of unknown function" AED:0.16 eAED:0.20 QI:0/-1/0/1/-1/1/1/0/122
MASRQHTLERSKDYDRGQNLQPIPVGTRVLVQDCVSKNWMKGGEIVKQLENGRLYRVRMPGGEYWRNRRFLRIDNSCNPPRKLDHTGTTEELALSSPRRSGRICRSGRIRRNVSFLGIDRFA